MSPETINAIKDALAPIAAKIGQGATYGWDVVVRQQYISGIMSLIWSGIGLLLVVVLVPYGIHLARKTDWNGYSPRLNEVGAIICFAFAFIGVNVVAFNLSGGIQHLLNAPYYALDFFIHLGSKTQ